MASLGRAMHIMVYRWSSRVHIRQGLTRSIDWEALEYVGGIASFEVEKASTVYGSISLLFHSGSANVP